MQHSRTRSHLVMLAGAAVAIALASGCTLKKQDAPPLTGPSELSTSIAVTATPDVIPQDGASQSVISIQARDANNQPLANLTLRLDIYVNNLPASDFGRLSTRNPTTGNDGRAVVVYTAPPWPQTGFVPDTSVRIFVLPVGSNFDNANWRSVAIRLVEPNVIYAPGSPVALFTFTPTSPRVGQNVFFDASSSSDPDGSVVAYQWVYGDGDVEGGQTQFHDFPLAGVYYVTLTVTDNDGKKASTTRAISVSP